MIETSSNNFNIQSPTSIILLFADSIWHVMIIICVDTVIMIHYKLNYVFFLCIYVVYLVPMVIVGCDILIYVLVSLGKIVFVE